MKNNNLERYKGICSIKSFLVLACILFWYLVGPIDPWEYSLDFPGKHITYTELKTLEL